MANNHCRVGLVYSAILTSANATTRSLLGPSNPSAPISALTAVLGFSEKGKCY